MKFKHEKYYLSDIVDKKKEEIFVAKRVFTDDGDIEEHSDTEKNGGYQRQGGIWTKANKESFIYYVLKNNPLPSIIIWESDKTFEIGDIPYSKLEIIDGQQRIETIVEFFGNELSISSKNKSFDIYFLDSNTKNRTFSNLKPEYRISLTKYEIAATVLSECSLDDVVSVFVQINSTGKKLVPHEIREANNSGKPTNSLFINLTRDCLGSLWNLNIGEKGNENIISQSTIREFIFRIFIFYKKDYEFYNEGKNTLDILYKDLISIDNEIREKFISDFEKFSSAFEKIKKNDAIFLSKMYFEIFFKFFSKNSNKNIDDFCNKINNFFNHMNKTDDSKKYVNLNDREIFTLRSSIQPNPKKIAYEKLVEILKR